MIFVDSSLIIALADKDDQFHGRSVKLLQQLEEAKMVSDLVLSESVTGVGARLGREKGKEVFENLLRDPSVKLVFLNRRLAERSITIYMRYGAKLSFADAVSVRMMHDNHMSHIASFDSDFDAIEGITRLC